mmetsp:Transcript_10496/g.15763  ORF Transcript_10496/g.15763 Transcript_10496/m.15763 type:complete len:203 (+) Transcript_10496:57-665(+)|eukprot:CAMPEP_0201544692 /NCGR_PEP_ID=MMETSP0173_2-20130828/1305_1 /ASSEMBLY_ACC=CAM_ASM_000268 /TAXON_ID=218659 /ORGANISM="Vexillifera sp., Strain DIVA3 564/2" /LENGTH=202 /DNA_ID=CAMNT_0047952903 /DNA_START=55 /DNA_END=663 /DNA_ORIENTATION=-
MGISRDPEHKRRKSGGKRKAIRMKRKFLIGRPPAMTKIAPKRVRKVRVRGGNLKFRALRLDSGSFSWGSEAISRKTRIIAVVYNASNNELVRTNTLVKNCIVQIDAAPFRQWYQQYYGVPVVGAKKGGDAKTQNVSKSVAQKHAARIAKRGGAAEPIKEQFSKGRLLACISSRPGQSGRADGYILEGAELDFYAKKLQKKKK